MICEPAGHSLLKQFVGWLPQFPTQVACGVTPDGWQQSVNVTELGNAHAELSHAIQDPHALVPEGQALAPVRQLHFTDS